MGQAIVDPADLRRFAGLLKRFTSDVENNMSLISGQLNQLSTTWRDQEQQKFQQEFEETMVAMKKFIEASNTHIPFLMRKAERAEEYLQQR